MSSRKIEDLHPIVQGMWNTFVLACEQKGIKVMVTSTLRTADEQLAYFAQGRKALKGVNEFRSRAGLPLITTQENLRIITKNFTSIHEFGCAIDFAIVKAGLVIWEIKADINENNISDYREAGEIAEKIGFRWGGRCGVDQKDFNKKIGWDPGHIEYTGGLTIMQLQAGLRPGEKTKGDEQRTNERREDASTSSA